jgi:hypothetical protein
MKAKTKSILSKVLAIAGTVLVWLPILFMFLTAIVGSIAAKTLLFDYLMLAELFFLVLAGAVLLFVAGLLSNTLAKWFGWSSAAAVLSLAGAQLIAIASGLAYGDREPSGVVFGVVIGMVVLYNILVVGVGVLGILLIKRLYAQKELPAETFEAEG